MKDNKANVVSSNPNARLFFAIKVLIAILFISAGIFAIAYYFLQSLLELYLLIILFGVVPFFLLCFLECIMKRGSQCWLLRLYNADRDFDLWSIVINLIGTVALFLVSPIEILVTFKEF